MTAYGVVLAAGRGLRMRAERNKALMTLDGRPLLSHSLNTLAGAAGAVLLVVAEADMKEIAVLLPQQEMTRGGATRQESEWCALSALASRLHPDDVVALHDAARPLVSGNDVRTVLEVAAQAGAAILAEPAELPLLDTGTDRACVETAYPASRVWRAQTPQAARAGYLLDAYSRALKDGFQGTDTASVLERYGYPVHVVPATSPNPKVTVPEDLRVVERLLGHR